MWFYIHTVSVGFIESDYFIG